MPACSAMASTPIPRMPWRRKSSRAVLIIRSRGRNEPSSTGPWSSVSMFAPSSAPENYSTKCHLTGCYRSVTLGTLLTGNTCLLSRQARRQVPAQKGDGHDDKFEPQCGSPRRLLSCEGAVMINFFITRPIFASAIAIIMVLAGGDLLFPAAGLAVSRHHAAAGRGQRRLSRRQRAGRRRYGDDAARAADQRRAGHDLHVLVELERRLGDHHRHLRRRLSAEHRRRRRAEPRLAGRLRRCRRSSIRAA